MISTTELFTEIRTKLVSSFSSSPFSVTVNAAYDSEAKKDQVVINSPMSDADNPTFSDRFNPEETVNVVLDIYGGTPKKKEELKDFVKSVLADDDLVDVSLIAVTEVDNTDVVNPANVYHSVSVTFTYLYDGGSSEGSS